MEITRQTVPANGTDEYIIMSNHMPGIIIICDAAGALHELLLQYSDYENAIQEGVNEEKSLIIRRWITLPMVHRP
jgi:hypothetical protein